MTPCPHWCLSANGLFICSGVRVNRAILAESSYLKSRFPDPAILSRWTVQPFGPRGSHTLSVKTPGPTPKRFGPTP
jgi:hypothetical protein